MGKTPNTPPRPRDEPDKETLAFIARCLSVHLPADTFEIDGYELPGTTLPAAAPQIVAESEQPAD